MFVCVIVSQVMFIQNKGDVTMTIELLDTEEAQADDPLDVQVNNTSSQTIKMFASPAGG